MKLLGRNNDLRTEDGRITKFGYLAAVLSSVFGVAVFFAGREVYKQKKSQKK